MYTRSHDLHLVDIKQLVFSNGLIETWLRVILTARETTKNLPFSYTTYATSLISDEGSACATYGSWANLTTIKIYSVTAEKRACRLLVIGY